MKRSPLPWRGYRPGARETERRLRGEALEFEVIERRVRGDCDHDRPILASGRFPSTDFSADRNPIDSEVLPGIHVGVDEHTHRVSTVFFRENAGRSSDSAFEIESHRARAGADRALFHGPPFRAFDRANRVLDRNVDAARVVQRRVIALGDGWRDHIVSDADVRVMLHHVGHDSVHHATDVHRVRQQDRHLERTLCLDPDAPGHLSRAVEHVGRGGNLLVPQVASVREDRRHAGSHRPLAGPELSLAAVQGDVTHADAFDVRNRIERSRGEVPIAIPRSRIRLRPYPRFPSAASAAGVSVMTMARYTPAR